ncbi:MAG: DnaA/Hda family protein [Pirellulaceae bacterium]|nr:DnaA/Hda family protein [Pirellulaceae bacterium]
MPDTEILATFRLALSNRIGADRFELWFGPTTRLTMAENHLLVEACDRFSVNWIRNHFRGDLEAVLHELGEQKDQPIATDVIFRVDSSLKRAESKDSTPTHDNDSTQLNLPLDLDEKYPSSTNNINGNSLVSDESQPSPLPGRSLPQNLAATNQSLPKTDHQSSTHVDEAKTAVSTSSNTARSGQPVREGQQGTIRKGPRKFCRLSDFIVGPNSRLAFTSCEIVAEQPGEVTPLLIHGPHGVGKTHLLEGIWSAYRRSGQFRRIVYLSAEQFTGYFLQALHGTGLPNFRRKYRDVELLILDDIQFFAGKRATLIELLHTVDAILRSGRQLVLASDRPPADLTALGSDILGRLTGGLVCHIDPPGTTVRRQLVEHWTRSCQLKLPENVLDYVAEQLPGDARQLRGAVNRLKAVSQANNIPISKTMAVDALADMIRSSRPACRIADVENAVCGLLGISPKSLQSCKRDKRIAQPRMLAMWLARKYTRSALSEIGQYFGGRSHSTVVSAQKKVQHWLDAQESVQLADQTWSVVNAIEQLESRLHVG